FRRTALVRGSFLFGSGKLLFSVTAFLLMLLDICNFGITQGVVMVFYNGAEYGNICYNEMLTHIEVAIISMLCMAICFLLLFGMNMLVEYVTLDTTNKMEINRYKTMLLQYKNQVNVHHDMKNHFISMSALADNGQWDKLKQYMSKIYGTYDNMEIETGNNIVNAIVNIKAQEAERRNIKFECDINLSRHLNIDEYDLCVIWGNILDNAINAAGIVNGERYVYVQGEIVKRNLIINIKNPIYGTYTEKFGKKNWGIGITNVNKIVKRLKGIMNIEIKDNVFEITIMLPVAENAVYDTK
ncbi:MAG: ATP-binding protein, partial [Ruminococcus sp.]|nr:ATP-binding protein [Ruminococcus sp.]